jgi:DNA-binding HxlR family transcriptional regulator
MPKASVSKTTSPKTTPTKTKLATTKLLSDEAFEQGPFSPAFHAATELIGKRWTGAILYSLFRNLKRFSDLEKVIPGLSGRMLSERLKELEAEGIIRRKVIPDTPVRVEYTLTKKGNDLRPILIAINEWANVWK